MVADLAPEARELILNSRLLRVRTTRLDAELIDADVPVESLHFAPNLEFAVTDEFVFGRYQFTVKVQSNAGDDAARLACTIVVQWILRDDYRPRGDEVADYFTATVGYMTAFPYARSILQQQAADLGVGTVVLGTVEYGQTRPSSIMLNGVLFEPNGDEETGNEDVPYSDGGPSDGSRD
jgi:hypothetical protein